MIDWGEPKFSLTICDEDSTVLKLACKTVKIEPHMIKANAGKSNLHMNTSPRQQMANIELNKMAVDVLHVKRTMSAKGVAAKKDKIRKGLVLWRQKS